MVRVRLARVAVFHCKNLQIVLDYVLHGTRVAIDEEISNDPDTVLQNIVCTTPFGEQRIRMARIEMNCVFYKFKEKEFPALILRFNIFCMTYVFLIFEGGKSVENGARAEVQLTYISRQSFKVLKQMGALHRKHCLSVAIPNNKVQTGKHPSNRPRSYFTEDFVLPAEPSAMGGADEEEMEEGEEGEAHRLKIEEESEITPMEVTIANSTTRKRKREDAEGKTEEEAGTGEDAGAIQPPVRIVKQELAENEWTPGVTRDIAERSLALIPVDTALDITEDTSKVCTTLTKRVPDARRRINPRLTDDTWDVDILLSSSVLSMGPAQNASIGIMPTVTGVDLATIPIEVERFKFDPSLFTCGNYAFPMFLCRLDMHPPLRRIYMAYFSKKARQPRRHPATPPPKRLSAPLQYEPGAICSLHCACEGRHGLRIRFMRAYPGMRPAHTVSLRDDIPSIKVIVSPSEIPTVLGSKLKFMAKLVYSNVRRLMKRYQRRRVQQDPKFRHDQRQEEYYSVRGREGRRIAPTVNRKVLEEICQAERDAAPGTSVWTDSMPAEVRERLNRLREEARNGVQAVHQPVTQRTQGITAQTVVCEQPPAKRARIAAREQGRVMVYSTTGENVFLEPDVPITVATTIPIQQEQEVVYVTNTPSRQAEHERTRVRR